MAIPKNVVELFYVKQSSVFHIISEFLWKTINVPRKQGKSFINFELWAFKIVCDKHFKNEIFVEIKLLGVFFILLDKQADKNVRIKLMVTDIGYAGGETFFRPTQQKAKEFT